MKNVLEGHPFFGYLASEMSSRRSIMHKLCSNLVNMVYAEEEMIFTSGSVAERVYFVSDGPLIYTPIVGSSFRAEDNECIAEATLCVDWRHQGDLTAQRASELFQLLPDKFKSIVQVHPRPWLIATSYAHGFHRFIHKCDQAQYIDFIRDKEFPGTCLAEIKSALHTRTSRYEGKLAEMDSTFSFS